MNLPLWVTDQIHRRGGRRVNKKPLPPLTYPPSWQHGHSCAMRPIVVMPSNDRRHYTERPKNVLDAAPGNIEEGDYRFWSGSYNPTTVWAECRCCGHYAFSKADRASHQANENCTVILVAASKLLLEQHQCVVCDRHTVSSHWGYPMCKVKCPGMWKFSHVSNAVRAAMALALRRNSVPLKPDVAVKAKLVAVVEMVN